MKLMIGHYEVSITATDTISSLGKSLDTCSFLTEISCALWDAFFATEDKYPALASTYKAMIYDINKAEEEANYSKRLHKAVYG